MANNKESKPNKKKLRTMALSLLLAVIVWIMVMSLTNPGITTTLSNLKVRFIGEMQLRSKGLAITGRDEIPALSAEVTGSRSDIMSFMDSINVQVDVSGITETGDYNLAGSINVPTTRITVEKENYGEIPIKVEPLVSKDIEVKVKQTGSVKNKLVRTVIINPTVTITGAESEVNSVAGAVATVDISKTYDKRPQRVSYLLTDSAGALINDNETLEATHAEVEIVNTTYDAKTVQIEPVLSSELEKIYALDKNKTTVSPSAVTVGLSGETGNKATVLIDRAAVNGEETYQLVESEGMYIPPESRNIKVKPELLPKDSAQLDMAVEAQNVGEGLRAVIDDHVVVNVRGERSRLNTDNVHAVVDAQNLAKGEYTLPVRLRESEFELEGEYVVRVRIE